jgi:O-antigen/teichoic acid export membrane protein
MKDNFFKLLRNQFIASSIIMILGSNFANFLNYIYHLVLGRLLGPIGYGELAGLLSLTGLISIIPGSLSIVITKFISSTEDKKELKSLILWISKFSFLLGGIFSLAIIISSFFVSNFFNFSSFWLVIILSISFIFSIPTSFNRSILQGRLLFKGFVYTVIAENLSKVVISLILIYIGWSIFGAVVGITLSSIFGWLMTSYYLRNLFTDQSEKVKIDKKKIFLYSVPILLQSLSITSLYSTDVLLVNRFFSSYDAGIYASLSTLSKILFFATGPVAGVMFPMVSQRKSTGGNFFVIFWYSIGITTLICLSVLALYWLIPGLIVNSLYGELFIQAKSYLFLISLSMAFYAISALCINFALAISKIRVVAFPIIAAILQIIGISIYHQSILSVIYVSLVINVFLFVTTFMYTLMIRYEKV